MHWMRIVCIVTFDITRAIKHHTSGPKLTRSDQEDTASLSITVHNKIDYATFILPSNSQHWSLWETRKQTIWNSLDHVPHLLTLGSISYIPVFYLKQRFWGKSVINGYLKGFIFKTWQIWVMFSCVLNWRYIPYTHTQTWISNLTQIVICA